MAKVLLISEDYIKSNSNISDNLWGKFLLPAIRESQEISLQQIIGENLLKSLLEKVEKNEITADENKEYKALLDDYIQNYLLYQVLSNVMPIIGTKLSNLGNMTTDDEKAMNVSQAERARLEDYYQFRADFYCKRLQEYLIANKSKFPELCKSDCHKLKANLYSSSSSGIWLGGKRGKF